MNATELSGESLRQTMDSAVAGIHEFRVISHAFVGQTQRAIDDLIEFGFRNRPAYPVRRDRSEVLFPELFVVREHEMLRDARTERLHDPLMKVFRPAVGRGSQCFDKPDNTFFDHFGGETVRVRLKRVRRHCGFRINRGEPFVITERIREDL